MHIPDDAEISAGHGLQKELDLFPPPVSFCKIAPSKAGMHILLILRKN
jgi:hypothetical protein